MQFPFAALYDGAQFGGILNAVVKGFEKNAGKVRKNFVKLVGNYENQKDW